MAETALQAEKDRSDARYAAAKSIIKKLGTLDAADLAPKPGA